MHTKTGSLVYLSPEELKQAEMRWQAYEAGLLKEQPRYALVSKDFVSAKIRRPKRKKTKAKRTYRDFCN